MSQVVLIPHISEKAIALADTGTYVFQVPTSSNKIEIAKTVEQTFKVKVVKVTTMITKGKQVSRRYGKHAGSRKEVKKALVTLKKGDSIKLFEEGAK
ncbi:50S ribosomal protein L23 [Patescibacteria group bacterium]|nr:MAG: 50S ribosomal protein L23 [Patescibacteria group bacterium]